MKKIGEVDVDSGRLLLVDPCYAKGEQDGWLRKGEWCAITKSLPDALRAVMDGNATQHKEANSGTDSNSG